MFDQLKKPSKWKNLTWPFIVMPLLLPCHAWTNKPKPYAPRVDLIAKVGNKRHIARLGTVIPLLQKPRFMCYFTAIGMRDSKSSTEGNFGLGFRWLSSKSITGFYGFYDLRKSAAGNKFNQITLGFEKLYRNFEFRTNFYLPTLDSKEASNRTIANVDFVGHNTELTLFQNRVIERPMKGLDLEFGGTIPRHRALSTHLAVYAFSGLDVDSVLGGRWRAEYRFSPWFAMNAEANYDKARKFSGYVGLKLSYSMGQSLRGIEMNSLRDKMTMLPVRDIDIVVGEQVTNIPLGHMNLPGLHPVIQQLYQHNSKDVAFTGKGSFKTIADFNAHYHGEPVSGFVTINTQNMKQLDSSADESKVEILVTNHNLYSVIDRIDGVGWWNQSTPYILRPDLTAKQLYDSAYSRFGSPYVSNLKLSLGMMNEDCAKDINIAQVDGGKVDRHCLCQYRDAIYFERHNGRPPGNDLIVHYDENRQQWFFSYMQGGNRVEHRSPGHLCNSDVESLFPSLPDVAEHNGGFDQQIANDAALALRLQVLWALEDGQEQLWHRVRVPRNERARPDVQNNQNQVRLIDNPNVRRIVNFNQNLNRANQDVKRSITLLRDRYGVISDDERRRLENEIETLLDNLQRVGHVGIPHGLSLEQENAYRNDGRYNERLRAIVAKRTLQRILNGGKVYTVTTLGGADVPLRDALIYVYKSIRGVGIEHDENFDRVGRAKDFVRALYEMGREYNHDASNAAPGRYRIRIGEREQVFFDDRLPYNGGRGFDEPACDHGHYNKLVETLNQIDPAVNFGGRFDMLAHNRIQELLHESFNSYREEHRESADRILAQSEVGVDEENRAASQEWLTFLNGVARPHIHRVMRREFYINHQNPANRLATQEELDNWTGVEDALIYMDLEEGNEEN